MRNKELDAALLLTEGAVYDILNGGRNKLVSVYVASPLVWGIHVSASSSISRIEGIEGKRFAISRFGSGSHLIATVDAAERGFSVGDMEFVVVDDIEGARSALANNEADVFLWEKHMTQPLVDSGEFRRIGERIVPWPAFVVSVRVDYLDTHSNTVHEALDIVADFATRLKCDPNGANRISAAYGIGQADARSWLGSVQWSHDRRCPQAAIDRIVAALLSLDLVQSAESIPSGRARLNRIWANIESRAVPL
ncbi:MAG TPA: hypothetical protein PKH39_17210 [Woeseiaceae bacterium]|nr:hypothetical protein [Woeseiaceae bacterium]